MGPWISQMAVLAETWDHGDMMNDGQGNGWMWLWGGLMMLLIVLGVVLAIWLILRNQSHREAPATPTQRAREILAERFARGEIDTEEYRDRLSHLS
jgi:putative membrane protein